MVAKPPKTSAKATQTNGAPATTAKPAIAKPAPAQVAPPAKLAPPVAVVEKPAPVVAAAPPAPTAAPAPAASAAPVTPAKPIPPAAPAAILKKEETIMETTLKSATDKAQTMFADMNERTKAAVEKGTALFADINEFSKGNVEALVESSKIATKGLETLGQEAADYTRKSFETMTATVKSLGAVKSPAEFMKLQSDYLRQSFDQLVAESSKTTEAVLKLAGEVAQPLSSRVSVAVEKMKVSA